MRETDGWIVMMTDFGADNIGTAAMKGVAASVDESLRLEDLTHSIEPFNVWQASDALMYAEPFWPKGTVFVSVVDPGVGTKRRACVAKLKDGKFVVTPDNGTLTHLEEFIGVEEIREIDETVNRLKSTVKTSVFHGRDLFAYCGAKLAAGVISFEEVGPAYPVSEIVRCPQPLHAAWQEDTAYGEVTSVSRTFGNVFTNIPISDLEAHGYELNQKYHLNISDGEETVYDGEIDYVRSFGFLSEGAPLIFNGSTLYLCIACNQASFLKRYHMDPSKHWKVTLSK
ncbi:SAM hydrolase/SAM-dependent halogenase family protein [Stecheria intestinalis]|uniref:SAM hydrolase/SAM-dependent halogenase family protein n=1 Tax=Stecheria intestinalis TaxID=2606630 RepID=UPI0023F3272F|nr:SAM-dependent chlorinase/fluorinase [Stecheria intestinalis]MDD5881053.1 SAM-dependent chlorinase/fluorinase [Stecheria intestinalis]